jgi:hypothetical protein
MSELDTYLLGQALQTMQSVKSEQREQSEQIKQLSTDVKEAISWAQRLILLAATWAAAIGINLSPDKAGETLAAFLRTLK